jgi:quinol monooxygenase YgiN
MIIVAGCLIVEPRERDAFVASRVEIVGLARRAPGCLGYAVSADPVTAGRVNIFERWESQRNVEDFRGGGPSGRRMAAGRSASVTEYDVADA